MRRPSAAERSRNNGLVFPVINFVIRNDKGIVTTNISISIGDIESIIKNEPTTVITLVSICTRSVESDVFTVSIS